MKLKNKFLIPTLLFSFIVLASFAMWTINTISNDLRKNFLIKANRISSQIKRSYGENLWNINVAAVEAGLQPIFEDEDIVAISIFDNGDMIVIDWKKEEEHSNILQKEGIIEYMDSEIAKYSVIFTYQAIEEKIENLKSSIIMGVSIFILILFLINSIVSYWATKPLSKIVEGVLDLEKGDFSKRIKLNSKDEFQKISDILNIMIDKLEDIFVEIIEKHSNVQSITELINNENSKLIEQALIQASSLEETSASTEEIGAGIISSLEQTKELDVLTKDVLKKAENTGRTSKVLETSFQEIVNSTKQIETIIKLMDDISFQTNLLSINAAVEAARAGVEGKGFAVVASEVRSLSKRSIEAAKEIKKLIKISERKVVDGSKVVEKAITNMEDVVIEINNVGEIISSIARTSDEGERGINEIGNGLGKLEQTTQENLIAIERIGEISQELHINSDNLTDLLKFFKLKGSDIQDSEENENSEENAKETGDA